MTDYRIFETDRFLDDIQSLARSGQPRMIDKLRLVVYPQLRSCPHYGPNIKKLRNWQPEAWRYRIGAWRFFYEIDETEHIISLIAAVHRKNAYR